jgi:7-cyano-7-deazaguanine tRNA-ribosyltransferase
MPQKQQRERRKPRELAPTRRRSCHFIVGSHLGPVPIELDHLYPFAQSVVPEHVDAGTRRYLAGLLTAFLEERIHTPVLRDHEESDEPTEFYTQEELYADPSLATKRLDQGPGIEQWDLDLLRIASTAEIQFRPGAAVALFGPGEDRRKRVRCVRSRRTGKIRNVLVDDEHVVYGDGDVEKDPPPESMRDALGSILKVAVAL